MTWDTGRPLGVPPEHSDEVVSSLNDPDEHPQIKMLSKIYLALYVAAVGTIIGAIAALRN